MSPKRLRIHPISALRITAVALLLLCLLDVQPAVHAQGNVIFVNDDATGANNGTSWANAFAVLQDAIDAATSGKEIWVAEGTYLATSSLDFTFQLKDGVAIYGGFVGTESSRNQRNPEANETVLSGDEGFAFHVVTGNNVGQTTILDGFTITGGNASGSENPECSGQCGGGIYLANSSPILANLQIKHNHAVYGGGYYSYDGGTPTLTAVTFYSNTAAYAGGGMYVYDNSSPTLSAVFFERNQAIHAGGGMYNYQEVAPILNNVTFISNTVPSTETSLGGGGMFNESGGDPQLTTVVFQGNQAKNGGGMYNNTDSNATLTDVEFHNNRAIENGIASGRGGGMYNTRSNPILTDVLFSANYASTGGGIFNVMSESSLSRTIFSGNFADVGGGMFNLDYSDTILTNTLFSGNYAVTYGGGIYVLDSAPVLTNVSISGNYAGELGGGIFDGDFSTNQDLDFQNTIVWGNVPTSSLMGHISATHSLLEGLNAPGVGNLDGTNPANDARFVRAVDCGDDEICADNPATPANEAADDDYGDLRLGPASPAIDAGDNAFVEDTGGDLAGNPRILAVRSLPATVDMGAYERVNTAPVADAGGPYSVNEGSPLALDGANSTDDGTIANYAWDCTDDGEDDTDSASPIDSTCTYPDNGTFNVKLTATDIVGANHAATAIVTVANVAPEYAAPPNQSTFAMSAKNFALGNFDDAEIDGSWAITVDWGDNITPTEFTVNGDGALPARSHTFATPGTYNVVVTVDDGDADVVGGFQVVVNATPPGAPLVTAPDDQTAAAGVEQSLALGSFTDPGSSGPWQISVNWGDNSAPTQFAAAATGTIAAKSHTYAATGSYDVVVTVHDGALESSASFQVTVSADGDSGSVTGMVFVDTNGNGSQEGNEAGVGGATLTLQSGDEARAAGTRLTRTATTGGSGSYRFDNLPPDEYTLTITLPAGFTVVGATQHTINVTTGSTTTAPSFSLQPEQGGDDNAIFLPNVQRP